MLNTYRVVIIRNANVLKIFSGNQHISSIVECNRSIGTKYSVLPIMGKLEFQYFPDFNTSNIL